MGHNKQDRQEDVREKVTSGALISQLTLVLSLFLLTSNAHKRGAKDSEELSCSRSNTLVQKN